jgi:hypothetical protein
VNAQLAVIQQLAEVRQPGGDLATGVDKATRQRFCWFRTLKKTARFEQGLNVRLQGDISAQPCFLLGWDECKAFVQKRTSGFLCATCNPRRVDKQNSAEMSLGRGVTSAPVCLD